MPQIRDLLLGIELRQARVCTEDRWRRAGAAASTERAHVLSCVSTSLTVRDGKLAPPRPRRLRARAREGPHLGAPAANKATLALTRAAPSGGRALARTRARTRTHTCMAPSSLPQRRAAGGRACNGKWEARLAPRAARALCRSAPPPRKEDKNLCARDTRARRRSWRARRRGRANA